MMYKIILSTKHEICIDADEYDRVVEAIKKGSITRVRQGIFNPSFCVAVVRDNERYEKWQDDQKYSNKLVLPIPLKDIFKDVVHKLSLPEKK